MDYSEWAGQCNNMKLLQNWIVLYFLSCRKDRSSLWAAVLTATGQWYVTNFGDEAKSKQEISNASSISLRMLLQIENLTNNFPSSSACTARAQLTDCLIEQLVRIPKLEIASRYSSRFRSKIPPLQFFSTNIKSVAVCWNAQRYT